MPSTTLLSSRSCTFINILGMWPICQGKGQSLYWRVKIKRVVLLSETLHKKAFTLCPYLQKYLILKSNTIISSKMLKAFTCQKNTAVLPFLNWLSIIPIMLAVWLAGWNVHLVSKYLSYWIRVVIIFTLSFPKKILFINKRRLTTIRYARVAFMILRVADGL